TGFMRHYEEDEGTGFELLTLAEIRSNLRGPQYLIKPFLEKETLCVMFGESGAYKSFGSSGKFVGKNEEK
ncbi:MAG: hypothetical protein GY799_01925, partial [Desulfobulbaceae bacterium]|nr:hypothetical protein [Desulfobulbaceae bacterium]